MILVSIKKFGQSSVNISFSLKKELSLNLQDFTEINPGKMLFVTFPEK